MATIHNAIEILMSSVPCNLWKPYVLRGKAHHIMTRKWQKCLSIPFAIWQSTEKEYGIAP